MQWFSTQEPVHDNKAHHDETSHLNRFFYIHINKLEPPSRDITQYYYTNMKVRSEENEKIVEVRRRKGMAAIYIIRLQCT